MMSGICAKCRLPIDQDVGGSGDYKLTVRTAGHVYHGSCWGPDAVDIPVASLRDYFAGQALCGLSTAYSVGVYGAPHISAWAYEVADAMLAERVKARGKS